MENTPNFGGLEGSGQAPATPEPTVIFNPEPTLAKPAPQVPPPTSANFTEPKNTPPGVPPAMVATEKEPNFWIETFKFVAIAVLIALPIRLWVIQPFIVNGDSMLETFRNADYLVVDQISYRFNAPERGDVIVFKNPANTSQFYIKRIIGLPGETVEINDTNVMIKNTEHPEGFSLSEPYIDHKHSSMSQYTLGSDEYFVMGDNRAASSDSRIWGPLKRDLIMGRALVRLWPITTIGVFPGKSTY